jgi:hypothetical protein
LVAATSQIMMFCATARELLRAQQVMSAMVIAGGSAGLVRSVS